MARLLASISAFFLLTLKVIHSTMNDDVYLYLLLSALEITKGIDFQLAKPQKKSDI